MTAGELAVLVEVADEAMESGDAYARVLGRQLAKLVLDHALLLEAAHGVTDSYERWDGPQWPAVERLAEVMR